MSLEKINFSYPRGSLQSVFDGDALTALELAALNSKKVDECVEIVNGVEQTAIEATAIVDDMQLQQQQFLTDNADTRAQLITDNQSYIADLSASKTTFETNMSNAVNTVIANAETTIETDVNNKIDVLVSDGTIGNLINVDTEKSIVEATGTGVITGLNVVQQTVPNMSVLISPGTAHLYNGKRYNQAENISLNIDAADPSYPRIDVIYINSSGVLSYGKGEAKAVPTAPTPLNGLILAELSITVSVLSITTSLITDKRVIKTNVSQDINLIKSSIVMIEKYRQSGMSDTDLINFVIANVNPHTKIIFETGRIYEIGSLTKIIKGVTLDFNNSFIKPKTNGVLFTFGYVDELTARSPKIINFIAIPDTVYIPTSFIKIENGLPNVVIEGYFKETKATHSLIHNFASYGLKIRGSMISVDCPRCIYLSNRLTLDGSHSYAVDINVDITRNTGIGIEMEGCNGKIAGVIESTAGGILYNGLSTITRLDLTTYFEANTNYDTKWIGDWVNGMLGIGINIRSQFIGDTNVNKIMIGTGIHITTQDCFFQYGGITAINPASVGGDYYIGINNMQSQNGTGFSNNKEIADNIIDVLAYNVINPFYSFSKTPPVFDGLSVGNGVSGTFTNLSNTVVNQTKNKSKIEDITYQASYDFTPIESGETVFNISVPSGYVITGVDVHYGTDYNNFFFEKTAVVGNTIQVYNTNTVKHLLEVRVAFRLA